MPAGALVPADPVPVPLLVVVRGAGIACWLGIGSCGPAEPAVAIWRVSVVVVRYLVWGLWYFYLPLLRLAFVLILSLRLLYPTELVAECSAAEVEARAQSPDAALVVPAVLVPAVVRLVLFGPAAGPADAHLPFAAVAAAADAVVWAVQVQLPVAAPVFSSPSFLSPHQRWCAVCAVVCVHEASRTVCAVVCVREASCTVRAVVCVRDASQGFC